MLQLTNLEKAVLRQICGQYPAQGAILEAQIASATVLSRENSGAGFFTNMAVDRSKAPALAGEGVLGNVWVQIDDFNQPMIFLLFLEDGYADCLEGATVDDNTEGVDFAAVTFSILE